MTQAVHDMFSSIASRYDLANDVLSLGIHRLWRDAAIAESGAAPGYCAVDLCTGTGDLARAFARKVGPRGRVIALDFVAEMLALGKQKYGVRLGEAEIAFVQADALQIPLPDRFADVISVAFGIRNVDDPLRCLREMLRVLKPGGSIVVLEFGQPSTPLFASLYRLYSAHIMPILGGYLTGNRAAYEYLPRTSREFPAGEKFLRLMREAQIENPASRSLFGGVAYIYSGLRPPERTE